MGVAAPGVGGCRGSVIVTADRGHLDAEYGPEVLPNAGGREAAAVLLDDRTADHQPQPQAAEVAARTRGSPARKLRRSGAASGSMPMPVSLTSRISLVSVGIRRTPIAHRETGPSLLPPAGVNLIAFLTRFQRTCCSRIGSASTWCPPRVRSRESSACAEILLADFDDVVNQFVGVDDLALQVELAGSNASQVQEVIDQPGLQSDIAADHVQHVAERIGRRGVVEHGRDGGEDRGQRRAELVAQGGKKAVLGPVGRLGLGSGCLLAEQSEPALPRRA